MSETYFVRLMGKRRRRASMREQVNDTVTAVDELSAAKELLRAYREMEGSAGVLEFAAEVYLAEQAGLAVPAFGAAPTHFDQAQLDG